MIDTAIIYASIEKAIADSSEWVRADFARLRRALDRRETALREIKRLHSEWFDHDQDGYGKDSDKTVREIERIVVSVWESEDA